ncbi:hypothetical protein [Parvularcula maris]|uniref:Uncharacterized protein n=1 Tax=Parvularcula maris TaxID=2965077 RepID=A0A9X2L8E9_9PROT|nr:hypothetical protein [Parvularcula maris]MCQ8184839.1 hypothetical protein [Parvularcula maris]
MDRFEFYKDQYEFELKRKAVLHRQFAPPTSLFVVLVASTFGGMADVDSLARWALATKIAAFSICCCLIVWLSFRLWRIVSGNKYDEIATMDAWEQQYEQNYSNKNIAIDGSVALANYSHQLIKEFIRCAAKNAILNEKRSNKLDDFRRDLLILSAPVAILYLVGVIDAILVAMEMPRV